MTVSGSLKMVSHSERAHNRGASDLSSSSSELLDPLQPDTIEFLNDINELFKDTNDGLDQ